MVATPARRIILISVVVSLMLVSLFLWRSADHPIAAVTKLTTSGEYSSGTHAYANDEEEKSLQDDGRVHPFSLSLQASSPTGTSQGEHGKHAAPSPAPTKDFAPPARPGNPTSWATGKPDNLTISGFVFYGRRDRVESMHCYLEVCPCP
jgi:hypothetical protein